MNLIRIVLFGDRDRRAWVILAVIVSGLSPVAGVAVVNYAIAGPITGQIDLGVPLIYLVVIVGIIASYVVSTRFAVANVEQVLADWRTAMHERVRRLELNDFERIGGTDVYDAVTRNTAAVTNVGTVVAAQASMLIGLIAVCIYTYFLSTLAFIIYLVVFGLGAVATVVSQRQMTRGVAVAHGDETRYLSFLRQLLGGFKEVRLHDRRGQELQASHLEPASHDLQSANIQLGIATTTGGAVFHGMLWASVGVVMFVLPFWIGDKTVIIQAIYVGIFLRGYLASLLANLPQMTGAEAALAELERVNRMLDEHGHDIPSKPAVPVFGSVDLRGVVFSYRQPDGEPGFTVGPLDLSLSRGELLFIVGENGGGKSTILKLLCRLYAPDAGVVLLDGNPVDDNTVSSFRGLFSAVFADFHLFDRLYGMPDCTDAKANALLEEFGIGQKVQVIDGAFTTTDLSRGQRQRLALVVAILEERPIMVLDEIAADQDPGFRAHLYGTVLPRLKGAGRTLVVVSHDNRYYDVADRIVTVADGRLAVSHDASGE